MAAMQEMSISEVAELVRDDARLRGAFVHEYSGPGDAGAALDLVADQSALMPAAQYTELARLAFGRPDPDRADAQRHAVSELEKLAAERTAVTVEVRRALLAVLDRSVEVAPPADDRRGNALVVLAIALVVLVGVVTRALLIPVPPLAIFDRSQTREEARLSREIFSGFEFPGGVLDSVRLVDRAGDSTFLAFQTTDPSILGGEGDGVCVYRYSDDGASGKCGLLEQVRSTGLSGSFGSSNGSYSFQWGPIGSLAVTRHN